MALSRAVFEGYLSTPNLGRCGLSYRLGETIPLPPAVQAQRRKLGWKHREVECYSAVCSIPDLGLESEEVVISVDALGSDGSRRLLLQSLARPDLGLTILRLDGTQLSGGDETWTPEAEPIISARWCLEPRAPSGSPRRRRPEPDAEPPSEELLGFGVVGGSELLDTETSSCMVLPMGQESKVLGGQPRILGCQPRRISRDGIGRLAGACLKEPLKAGYGAREAVERPDEATKGLEQDQERLVAAAVLGEVADVQQLVGHVRLDGLVESGRYAQLTALMAAAARGRSEVVRELLERKAGLDVKDPQGWTALMHGIHGQRLEVCKLLLDAKAQFQDGTSLILAASGARYELCKMLVDRKAALSVPDTDGCTALHHAARRGRGAAVATLLAARAKLEKQDAQGLTPLMAAAAAGRADTVQLLLANKADAHALDASGRGAKDLAVAYQHSRVLQVLGR